jgi:hypothetical protein
MVYRGMIECSVQAIISGFEKHNSLKNARLTPKINLNSEISLTSLIEIDLAD